MFLGVGTAVRYSSIVKMDADVLGFGERGERKFRATVEATVRTLVEEVDKHRIMLWCSKETYDDALEALGAARLKLRDMVLTGSAVEPPATAPKSPWVTSANCGGIFNVNDVLYMFADASLEDGEWFPTITAVLKHNNQCVYYWTDDEGFDDREYAVQIARENMVKVWEDFTSRLSGGGCE